MSNSLKSISHYFFETLCDYSRKKNINLPIETEFQLAFYLGYIEEHKMEEGAKYVKKHKCLERFLSDSGKIMKKEGRKLWPYDERLYDILLSRVIENPCHLTEERIERIMKILKNKLKKK